MAVKPCIFPRSSKQGLGLLGLLGFLAMRLIAVRYPVNPVPSSAIQCHNRYIVQAVQASGRRVATGMGGVRLWGAWRPRNRGLSPKAKEFAQHVHNILEFWWILYNPFVKNLYRKQPILDPFGRQGCFWCVPFVSRMSWLAASIEHANQGL